MKHLQEDRGICKHGRSTNSRAAPGRDEADNFKGSTIGPDELKQYAIDLNEIKRYEVTEVYSHPNAKVDIVFVHGLNGDPRLSWTSKEKGTFWPTQLLPVSLKSAQARILVYGYNADVYTFGSNKGGPRYAVSQTSTKNAS